MVGGVHRDARARTRFSGLRFGTPYESGIKNEAITPQKTEIAKYACVCERRTANSERRTTNNEQHTQCTTTATATTQQHNTQHTTHNTQHTTHHTTHNTQHTTHNTQHTTHFNSIFTHFPKDRNCEVCLRTKIRLAPCRRRTGKAVPRAEKFSDLITADHNVLNEESEPRNNHRYASVVQDLATQWIQS